MEVVPSFVLDRNLWGYQGLFVAFGQPARPCVTFKIDGIFELPFQDIKLLVAYSHTQCVQVADHKTLLQIQEAQTNHKVVEEFPRWFDN